MVEGKKPGDPGCENVEQIQLRKTRGTEYRIGRHFQLPGVRNLPVGNIILHRIDSLRFIRIHQIRSHKSSGQNQSQRRKPCQVKQGVHNQEKSILSLFPDLPHIEFCHSPERQKHGKQIKDSRAGIAPCNRPVKASEKPLWSEAGNPLR